MLGAEDLQLAGGRADEGKPGGLPLAGSTTHPSAQTVVHWRAVAQCMRHHGVSGFPDPTTSVTSNLRSIGQVSDRDGAIFAIPATINQQASAFTQPAGACGFIDAYQSQLYAQENRRRTQTRQQLLIQSGIALAGMSLSAYMGRNSKTSSLSTM